MGPLSEESATLRLCGSRALAAVLLVLAAAAPARADATDDYIKVEMERRQIPVGPQKPQADAEPALTARLRELLQHVAKNEPDATVLPPLVSYISPVGRALTAERLATLKSFTFVSCDDAQARAVERLGARVSRVCHYRLVNAEETRYYSFWLTADNTVADFWSSTE